MVGVLGECSDGSFQGIQMKRPFKVAITGGKGGTGKSTVACSLAVAMADEFRVLLVDADVECPDDHVILPIIREKSNDVTLEVPCFVESTCSMCGRCSDVCRENALFHVDGMPPTLFEDRCNGCGTCVLACPTGSIKTRDKVIGSIYEGIPDWGSERVMENFRLLSGESIIGTASSATVVDALMDKAEQEGDFDFIIVDTPAGLHCNVIRALMRSHMALAVTEPTPLGVHDLKLILALLDGMGLESMIVINRYGVGDPDIVYDVAHQKKVPVAARIPYSEETMRAYSEGRPHELREINEIVDLLVMRCLI
ncbi:P-loop NTPase [Methanothermobacter sp. THM-2]|nr:P-loop NTPase [Methanothermobacter sp. THM-2]